MKIDEMKKQILLIQRLAQYYDEFFREPLSVVDSFKYALEAYEDLAESLEVYEDPKDYENFTNLLNAESFEEFVKILDNELIDYCIDTFEKT